jgi:hypothetical protein
VNQGRRTTAASSTSSRVSSASTSSFYIRNLIFNMRRRSVITDHAGSEIEALPVAIPRPLRPAYQRAPSSTMSSKSSCNHCGNLAPRYGLTTIYGTPLNQSRAPSPMLSPPASLNKPGGSASSSSSVRHQTRSVNVRTEN